MPTLPMPERPPPVRAPMRALSAILVAGMLLLAGCSEGGRPAGGGSAPPPAKVSVAEVLQREIVEWDEFTGRIEAKDSVEVRARVSGVIEQRVFAEGGLVDEGDLLFVLDREPFEVAVARAEAALARARAQLALAVTEAERAGRLAEARNISEEEVDRREAEVRVARAAVQSARAELDGARLNLSWTEIRAPISGRISRAYVTPGNLIEGGNDNATLLALLVSVDPLYVYYDVDERTVLDYRRLAREGRRPSARFDRLPARVALLDGQGYRIDGEIDYAEPRIDPETGTVNVRAVIPNADDQLSPGLFARVRVPGSAPYEAILINERALQFDQGNRFVWVVGADDMPEYRRVELGPVVDGLRVVRAGLGPGERIVVAGLQRVRPRTAVDPEIVPMPGADDAAFASPVIYERRTTAAGKR